MISDMFSKRREELFTALAPEKDVQALYITREVDVTYLTGFTGDMTTLMITKEGSCLFPGRFFYEQASDECKSLEVNTDETAGVTLYDRIKNFMEGKNIERVGVQGEHLNLLMAEAIGKGLERELVTLPTLKNFGRIVKTDEEVELITKAIQIGEQALQEIVSKGASNLIGRTEEDIRNELEYRMRCLGASDKSFASIVAAGSHSSRCHHFPGSRVIEANQTLLIDWGAKYKGYCGDLTRTFFIGSIPERMEEIYNVVLGAQQAAIEAMKPGAICGDIDKVARDFITEAGFGKQFIHGLGHGLGLDVHEMPSFHKGYEAELKENMVMTVEPGIYFAGMGGVRIEDDILVTADGYRKLSSFPRELESMIIE